MLIIVTSIYQKAEIESNNFHQKNKGTNANNRRNLSLQQQSETKKYNYKLQSIWMHFILAF